MRKFLFISFAFVSLFMDAQTGNENVSFSTGNFFTRANRPTNKEYVVDGSPYLNSNFEKVKIDGYSANVQTLRYNLFEDEMEFRNGDDTYFANKEEGLKITFVSQNKTYQCLNYFLDGKGKFGYLVLLVDNHVKFSLFKREKSELLKGEKSPNAYGKDANDYFAKEKEVYILKDKNTFVKFPKNQKEFLERFASHKNEFSSFIKEKRINFSKEEDLIKLCEYLNTL